MWRRGGWRRERRGMPEMQSVIFKVGGRKLRTGDSNDLDIIADVYGLWVLEERKGMF